MLPRALSCYRLSWQYRSLAVNARRNAAIPLGGAGRPRKPIHHWDAFRFYDSLCFTGNMFALKFIIFFKQFDSMDWYRKWTRLSVVSMSIKLILKYVIECPPASVIGQFWQALRKVIDTADKASFALHVNLIEILNWIKILIVRRIRIDLLAYQSKTTDSAL